MIEKIHSQLQKCELPSESEIKSLFNKAKEIFITEPNMVVLYPPISVCGDIHGQFYDLLELFAVGDDCPETSYLFLGDYVDRGYHSIETFLYLLTIKVKYPSKITLLRGNHESRSATRNYGFYLECKTKFGNKDVYNWCMDVFDLLPISAIIGQKLFAVHGGLSPKLNRIDNIHNLNRVQEIEPDGIISDLMWSDPDEDVKGWVLSNRGAGYLFGAKQVKRFNEKNGLSCILRSHQLVSSGYQYMFDESLCIVWSSPNYCYRCGNVAAILEIDEHTNRKFNIFTESPDFIRKDIEEIYAGPAYFL